MFGGPLFNPPEEAWTRVEVMEMMRNEQVLGFLLKTKSTELLYGLNVGCERKRGIKGNTKALA